MKIFPAWNRLFLPHLLLAVLGAAAAAEDMTLDYLYRYNCQTGEPDHLMAAVEVGGGRCIIAGNRGLVLVAFDDMTPQGTQSFLDRLQTLDGRNMYVKDDRYVFVDLHRTGAGGSFGFAVVEIVGDSLVEAALVEEPGVFYEKMCIDGDYLYIAAHSRGMRIFSIADPENPVQVGGIEDGFTDAFAVAAAGDRVYVADGGGGLKIVDVTSKTDPFLVGGEDPSTAAGTSEDVTVKNGTVYVAAGGAGVAVYPGGDLAAREMYALSGCAKQFCWIGEHLAVATMEGFAVLDTAAPQGLPVAASEVTARRGPSARLRICSSVDAASGGRILCSDWNYLDVYELKTASSSTQADISCSHQRIRFGPGGGSQEVTVTNTGAAPLQVAQVQAAPASFSVDYGGGTLAPGDSQTVTVSYNGSPSQGEGTVLFHSNDPDESPLPIQVFGNTATLDPGETAVDFTFPALRKDPAGGGYIEEPFTLSDHLGKIVWLQIYGSW